MCIIFHDLNISLVDTNRAGGLESGLESSFWWTRTRDSDVIDSDLDSYSDVGTRGLGPESLSESSKIKVIVEDQILFRICIHLYFDDNILENHVKPTSTKYEKR